MSKNESNSAEGQTVTEDQLFQQFTKNHSAIQQNFNMLFEASKQLMLKLQEVQAENAVLKGEKPKSESVVVQTKPDAKPPNRKARRAEAKKSKKK